MAEPRAEDSGQSQACLCGGSAWYWPPCHSLDLALGGIFGLCPHCRASQPGSQAAQRYWELPNTL